MIIYKDVFKKLSDAGYTTYRLRQEKLMSQSTMSYIRQGKMVSLEVIDMICRLTHKSISDIIEYKEIPKENKGE